MRPHPAATLFLVLAAACTSRPNAAVSPANPSEAPGRTTASGPALHQRNPFNGLPADTANRPGGGAAAPSLPDAFAVAEAESAEGLAAAEIVVEDLHANRAGLVAVVAERAGRQPDIGPLRPATPADVTVARVFGARLTASLAVEDAMGRLGRAGVPALLLTSTGAKAPPRGAGYQSRPPNWTYTLVAPSADDRPSPVRVAAAEREALWKFDPVAGAWNRVLAEGTLLADAGPLPVANVVILTVPGNPASEDYWVGRGAARILAGAREFEGTWSRGDPDARLALVGANGTPAELTPGNAWIILAPASASIGSENS